ncbi:DUF397 domain-containing protein [Embleya sp. NPDC020630]|uniref:DUF397 domain-containing protein n=1 Tax=Embleya sp. NPDC020630 TaxID=3363979 RepID=UPI0037A6DACF
MNTSHATVQWRKSSHSGAESNCVEVATVRAITAVRDSKDPDRGHIGVPAGAWQALLDATVSG